MSSRLLGPDEVRNVEAMPWPSVSLTESGGGPLARAGGVETAGQVELRIREARAAALQEGEASGQRRAAAELQPVLQRLCQSIEEISGMRARLRREAEEDVVQLALAVARRILARELAVDPEAIRGLVIGALERLRGQEISRVRVHPAHAAAVRSCLQQMCSGTAVEVAADSTCAPGTVVVETPRGRLDASVDSQLREIERGLADRLRRRS